MHYFAPCTCLPAWAITREAITRCCCSFSISRWPICAGRRLVRAKSEMLFFPVHNLEGRQECHHPISIRSTTSSSFLSVQEGGCRGPTWGLSCVHRTWGLLYSNPFFSPSTDQLNCYWSIHNKWIDATKTFHTRTPLKIDHRSSMMMELFSFFLSIRMIESRD